MHRFVYEHILQHDWCSSTSQPERTFLKASDIENCVIERILRNKFQDPMISSESDDDDDRPSMKPKIDWEKVFKKNVNDDMHKAFVPALKATAPYPKQSVLTKQHHYQCLKVICAQNPNVLPLEFIPPPTKTDHRVFEEVKETYLNEKNEYMEWVKSLWTSSNCVRALRPKPIIESVYAAEFEMRACELNSFPKNYEMAAHISLCNNNENRCQFVHKQDLVNVNLADLPKVEVPQLTRRLSIMRQCPMPEPCLEHPCWFILPNENNLTVLPLPEIHRELAQYSLDKGAEFIASESALKCLMQMDTDWLLPLSVCEVIHADGDKRNVLVIGSEFSVQRKSAMARTYRAYRHLLEHALIPATESAKLLEKAYNKQMSLEGEADDTIVEENNHDIELTSDEDDDHLVINEDDESMWNENQESPQDKQTKNNNDKKDETDQSNNSNSTDKEKLKQKAEAKKKKNDCNCKDSMFDRPPIRSFKKWQITNTKNDDTFDLIVHCSHKMKGPTGEVISEPITEYQIDLGGAAQSEDKIKSLALSLLLRKNATLINVRVDSVTGEVARIDTLTLEDLTKKHANIVQDISNTVYESLGQLRGLLPGHYILQHETTHGTNAFLYATRMKGGGQKLSLNFDRSDHGEADEAKNVKTAPVLTDVLLPYHKYRKILPCAFPPFPDMVVKETKKPPAKTKPPPQALRWPKRKKRKNKKN